MTKTRETFAERVDALMEEASQALVACKYFLCESRCLQAMDLAHRQRDYDRMVRICLPLQEARRQKRDMAVDSRQVFVIDDQLPKPNRLHAGCYLVRPPRVGLDGRMLREMLDNAEVPAIVVVREPTTQAGLWPVVALGPATVRTKVMPPVQSARKRGAKKAAVATRHESDAPEVAIPPVEWFLSANEALGDAAIASVDPARPVLTRIEALLMRLGALPDHEKLHQALAAACAEAATLPPEVRALMDPTPEDELDRELAEEEQLKQGLGDAPEPDDN
ncbi:MAG: hypothetical protein ACKVS8_06545 [Phycisphaerales bacterium]